MPFVVKKEVHLFYHSISPKEKHNKFIKL